MNRPEKIVTRHYGDGTINAAPSDRGFGHRSNAIFESEYTRADIADARVAAAYEAAANEARSYMEPHVANGIRALATDVHTNALEDVRRETHDSAIHGLLKEIEGHLPEFGAGDPQDKTDLIIDQTWRSFRKIALSKLSTAQEDKT